VRIFIALDIDQGIRDRIRTFLEDVRGFAPEARWVLPESLHVTLKFIGEKPPEMVSRIKKELAAIMAPPIELVFRSYGFFPTPKAPRVFWVGIESGPDLTTLAGTVDDATGVLGVARADRPFSPHLTLARRGGASGAPRWHKSDDPNQTFQRLQEKMTALPMPEFGTMTAREFFLYESQLSRNGSRYTKLERFALRENGPATGTDPHNS
jgi:RNA 2',3'-cyclic 3'-phosphodiesterase